MAGTCFRLNVPKDLQRLVGRLESVKKWEGTAASLKKALEDHVRNSRTGDLALINDNAWPRRPNILFGRISRIAPSLRKIGISVGRGEGRAKRMWTFKVLGDDPTK